MREDKLPEIWERMQKLQAAILWRHLAGKETAKQEIFISFVILLDLRADVALREKLCKCSVNQPGNLVGMVRCVQSVSQTLIAFSASMHAVWQKVLW